jgi:hypothetical protein
LSSPKEERRNEINSGVGRRLGYVLLEKRGGKREKIWCREEKGSNSPREDRRKTREILMYGGERLNSSREERRKT